MSSESEWSCRVEGSGSQCNVLIQPNHQSVLVRERQDRQKEGGWRHTEKTGNQVATQTGVKDYKDRGRKTERGVRVN